jgi:hemoglobin-like flavoprotein
MLQASLQMLMVAAQGDPDSVAPYLDRVAARHGAADMAIGAELYDLWLDALLATVHETDPDWTPGVSEAWEDVMTVGIRYLLGQYNRSQGDRTEA